MTENQEQSIIALSVLIGSISIWAFFFYSTSQKKAPYPPCPPSHWLLGNALQLPDPVKDPHMDLLLLEWSKAYGKIFSFTIPVLGRFVVVADPDFVRHILISKNYRKSPTYGSLLPVIGSRSIIIANHKEWGPKRRAFNPGFAPDFLSRVACQVVLEKVRRLLNKCTDDVNRNVDTIMHERATEFTSDVIAQLAFGEDWGCDVGEHVTNETQLYMTELVTEVSQIIRKPLYRLLNRKKRQELTNKLNKSMKAVVERRMMSEEKEMSSSTNINSKDILSLAIKHLRDGGSRSASARTKSRKNINGNGHGVFNDDFDMDTLVDQLKTFYFAGHDTTAALISWTIWLVAQHPDVLHKIRKEAATELGPNFLPQCTDSGRNQNQDQRQPVGEDADRIMYEKLQRCTYLKAVLNEALRLHPPAATARYCDNGNEEYKGYRIGRCFLYISCYVIHRHPDLWEDPDEFQPDRFLDTERNYDNVYMPFSRGMRDCIGKYFAILEAQIGVLSLLLKFDVTVVNTDEKPSSRITSRPMNGAKVRFSLRS